MKEIIKLKANFKNAPKILYEGWLNSKVHSAFTGGQAKINPKIGFKYSAWDDYISGAIQELEPNKRILQTWRTTEFKPDDEDSMLEIILEDDSKGGTKLTLNHWNLPEGSKEGYTKGWKEFYFKPMKKYFSTN